MNSNRICTSLILLFFSISAFSQIDSTRRDSIEEIIIYEYDTIYIQPDTIRITDTIFEIVKRDSVKTIKPNVSRNRSSGRGISLKGILPKSIGFSVAPFMFLNENIPSDTLSSQSVFNANYNFQINYYSKKYLLSIGLGYSPYHERYSSSNKNYSSNQDTSLTGSYDSLLISNNYQINYYYNYLNINLLIGRKFSVSKKLELSLNLGTSVDFLVGYSQGNTSVSDSLVKKYNLSLIFSPQLTYKIGQNLEFKLSPFYQRSVFEDRKYPYV